jgi:hypothetical protein
MQRSAYLGRTGFAQPDGLRPTYMGVPDLGFKDAQGVAAGGDIKKIFHACVECCRRFR